MGVSWIAAIALATTVIGASIKPEEPWENPFEDFVDNPLEDSADNWSEDLANNPLELEEPLENPLDPGVDQRSGCGRVWVTVHSPELRQGIHNILDALEINWDFNGCASVPGQIGLFRNRPTAMGNAVISTLLSGRREGRALTNVALGTVTLPAGWQNGRGTRGTHCLWPWVAAGDTQIVVSNCLKIQPTWMEDYAGRINRLRIGQLAIPGTHNAGSWRFDTELSSASRDRFVLCQDRSIWAQLVHGIRYFDFRPAFYGNYQGDNRYWLNHGQIRVRPLLPLLREIRRFLDSTREVIFLDAHQFPVGFYNNGAPIRSVHQGFISMVQRELGPHLALHTNFWTPAAQGGPTLQALINANRRLVFSYIDNTIVNENNWLWPRVPHLWANSNQANTVLQFLDRQIPYGARPGERSPLHAAMAQTTPTALDIITLRGSLRENADAINRFVTMRMKQEWRRRVNIIASDFFLGNDAVDVSIILNLERSW